MFIRPRSVGAEHVALEALRRLGLDVKLAELGLNRHQLHAAIGVIVGRMVHPGSELATHQWLQQRSGLGELLDYDFNGLDLSRCIGSVIGCWHTERHWRDFSTSRSATCSP